MPNRRVWTKSGTITADAQWELDPLDYSRADEITLEVVLTGNAGADANDKLNVRLQSRTQANKWTDRIALDQLTGAMLAGEVREGVLQKFGTLSDSEEQGEPSGSTGGSRLTAGTVKNGSFPGRYRNSGVGTETGWRVDLDITDATDPSFPITLNVYADTPD
jgi:hypothetical protein